MNDRISVLIDDQVSDQQRADFFTFEEKCFEKDLKSHRDLLYFSQPFAHIFLNDNGKLISYLRVFIRKVSWKNQEIALGGVGSVATDQKYRGKGIATQLLKKAMKLLKREHVDFAILQTYIPKGEKLYGQVGFYPANKGYTFFDAEDQLRAIKAKNVMVAPIENKVILEEVLQNEELIHIGKGDW